MTDDQTLRLLSDREIAVIAKRVVDAHFGTPPHGCICPPGSEATCAGISCPRRAWTLP